MNQALTPDKKYDFRYQPNELHPELRNVMSMISFDGANSGARKQMFASHIQQRLVTKGAETRRIQSGTEAEYGKATFRTQFNNNSDVIKVIPYYRPRIGDSEIKYNPETLVIFQDDETKEIDCLSLKEYSSHHPYFGYRNLNTKHVSRLKTGESFAAGTVLQTTPANNPDGNYDYGLQAETALFSHPAASEDGMLISESLAARMGIYTYEKRTVEFGSTKFPINLYGDEKNYRICPGIGEYIHESTILMAFRKYDEDFAPVSMSRKQTRVVDQVFDQAVYVAGRRGKVVDIRVTHDPNQNATTPIGMVDQLQIYDSARREYFKEILEVYNTLVRQRGDTLELSHKFSSLVVKAISVVRETEEGGRRDKNQVIHPQKLHRGNPIDDWRIDFVIEYEITPNIGFKITGTQGDKGVVCAMLPDEKMPRDKDGNIAHLVMDPNATVSRMILGRLYEQYINAAARDLSKEICRALGAEPGVKPSLISQLNLQKSWDAEDQAVRGVWARLMRFYDILNPEMHFWFTSGTYKRTPVEHLLNIIHKGIYIFFPGNNDRELPDIIRNLESEYAPCYDKLTYVGNSGKTRVTKQKIRIGSIYLMLLEKTGDDWTAVSSGKFQNFGVLAKITSRDRYSQPSRNQAIRAWGESEIRIIAAYCGPLTAAELLDRNSNITTHKVVVESIIKAANPANVVNVVDRNKYPLGKARPLQLVKHLAFCGGWMFSYKPYVDPEPTAGQTGQTLNYDAK